MALFALLTSLSDKRKLQPLAENQSNALEIPWGVFAGRYSDILSVIVSARAMLDGDLSRRELIQGHIQRGLNQLSAAGTISTIDSLIGLQRKTP